MTCAAFPWQCGGWGAAARPVPSLSGCSSLHFLLLLSCHPAVAHLGAGESCPLGAAPCQVFALQCILHLVSVFFFPFVLWLYANFVRDEDQGYLFLLIINSLSILFSFLFGRGLHCHRTATVVPTLFSFVCLSAWHCPKINCKGGKWCEGSSLGLNREEISESCF